MKPHVHKPGCLDVSWARCPGMGYEDWVRVARDHRDQNLTWRSHEYHARLRARAEDPAYVDLGGEA